MADPKIVWTPRDEVSTAEVNLETLGGLERFRARPVIPRSDAFTVGGRGFSQYGPDAYFEIAIRLVNIARANAPDEFSRLWSLVNDLNVGGVVAVQFDSGKIADTTLTTTEAKGSDDLTVASSSAVTVGEYVYVEDVDDRTKYGFHRVDAIPTGTRISLYADSALTRGYGVGSVVRSKDYFPKARLLRGQARLELNDARRGGTGDLWTFDALLRSVIAP